MVIGVLLLGCVGLPLESAVDAIWPFPGATGVDGSSRIVLQHDQSLYELPYGLERVYTLIGPEGELPLQFEVSTENDSWLLLSSEGPLSQGEYALEVSEGTDSKNFDRAYRRPEGLIDVLEFSTVSRPAPLCWVWYDLDDQAVYLDGAAGLIPCVHWSERLIPGWVDLGSDQFTLNGQAFKTTGIVPEAFPELLCAVLPETAEPAPWSMRVDSEDLVTWAGGVLQESVTVSTSDTDACPNLVFVLPRWRPEG